MFWTLESLFRSNVIIRRAHKAIQGDDCRLRRRSWLRLPWLSPILWTLECLFRSNVCIHRAPKAIQVDGSRRRRRSWLRFPWLSPIRNPCELRGLYRRSYFGPRTCGGCICRQGRTRRGLGGGGGGCDGMCTLHAVVVLCLWY
jgi:hypothetical protein